MKNRALKLLLPFPLLLALFPLLSAQRADNSTVPVYKLYNIFRNNVPVYRLPSNHTIHPVQESDRQYRILSRLSNDFTLAGSSFFNTNKSKISTVAAHGLITRNFPDITELTRIKAYFKKRGLNYISLNFKKPVPIPIWAESFEIWAHGYGIKHHYRLIYQDEAGVEYSVKFGATTHFGWNKFVQNIPCRSNKNLPFSKRYRKLWLTKMLVLDDHAAGERFSLYHIAFVGCSRISRTIKNQKEHWRYIKLLDFGSSTLDNFKTGWVQLTNTGITVQPLSNDLQPYLGKDTVQIYGEYSENTFPKAVLKFTPPLKTRICRSIIVSVFSRGSGETIGFILKTIQNKYYFVETKPLFFRGWKKLYIKIPDYVDQKPDKTASRISGLSILQMIIFGHHHFYHVKNTSLLIDRLGAVEEPEVFISPNVKIMDPF